MTKRVIILSDGTGNSSAKVWRTNVWRTFEALDLADADQVAFYDNGIGTSEFKPFALFGGIFGYGLKRNVLECYKFLCRNYEPNAEIFLFGFSRGAFTIRVLTELIADRGLVPYQRNDQKLSQLALAAYRAYRKKKAHTIFRIEEPLRAFRDVLSRTPYAKVEGLPVPNIRFVGLWDTVAAYGFPIEEMTRVISQFIFPLELASSKLPSNISRACHALSIDDERKTFHPLLLNEDNEQCGPDAAGESWVHQERISQVWFSGVHANVGGGYPDDSMAHIPLNWMVGQAARCGLGFKASPTFEPDYRHQIETKGDINGRLYNSRSGLAGYYRYAPRNLDDLYGRASKAVPKIHWTVFEGIRKQVHSYAPLGIPPPLG